MKVSIYILALCMIVGCHKQNSIGHILIQADSLMMLRPDSSLLLLQTIDKDNIGSAAERAYYALLLSQANMNNNVAMNDDSIARIAYRYYSKSNDLKKYAQACYCLGRMQIYESDDDAAMRSFLEAADYAVRIKDNCLLGMIYSQLAYLYERQNLFDKSRAYYEMSLISHKDANMIKYSVSACINIGKTYSYENDHENAVKYYEKAIDLAAEAKDTVLILDINRSIASIHLRQNKPFDAESLMLKSYKNYNHGDIPPFYSDYFLLGAIYSSTGDLNNARRYLNLAKNQSIHDINSVSAVEFELYCIEEEALNYSQAIDHLYSHYIMVDSLHWIDKQNSVFEIEKKYKTAKLEYENFRRETVDRYIYLGITIFVVIMILIFLSSYKRHKRRMKERDNQIKEYLINIHESTNSKNELLSILDIKNDKERKFKELLEKRFNLLGRYYNLLYTYQSQPDLLNKKINELVLVKSIEQEAFLDIRGIVNEKYNGFVDQLESIFPDVSENDVNLLCLVRLGFSTQQMCAIYNTRLAQTIYTKKNRLANKLKFKNWESLESYIMEIKN